MPEFFDVPRLTHLIDMLSPARLTRVVDIGANPLDESPYYKLRDAGLCEVWGFELHQGAYEQLAANAGPREHYLPYAVGAGGKQTLKVFRGSGFTSLYEPNPNFSKTTGLWPRHFQVLERVDMPTKRLDSLKELPEFDLLKIDVQGAETQVFKHGRKKLSKAAVVISEVAAIPLYKDQPLMDQQMGTLGKYGYYLHKFLAFKGERLSSCERSRRLRPRFHRNQLIDGDAVFIRHLLDLERLKDEELKQLAILADGVFESFDVVAIALTECVRRGILTDAAADSYIDRLHKTFG